MMSISSVATRIGVVLNPHTRDIIGTEFTVRRNELSAQGCSRVPDDEIIEGLVDDLFYDINAILNRNISDEMAG
jgi:hypothetical protein